jgi:hypothetical protein
VTVEEFTAHLEAVRTVSRGYLAKCPSHADRHPSLSIKEGDRGVLVKCWAGCTIEAITQAMGLSMRDLFYDTNPDPATLHEARARRQAERNREWTEYHLSGLDADSQREAQRLVEQARNIDISEWAGVQLEQALNVLAAAHRRLQREGSNYYDFAINL